MFDLLTRGAVRLDIIRSKLANDRRAVTALEYGLIASVIVATVVVGFTALGNSMKATFMAIGTSL